MKVYNIEFEQTINCSSFG